MIDSPTPIPLNPELEGDLRRLNPWWDDPRARPRTPALRRHLVADIQHKMDLALAPIVAVRGPRQIGKTTAQLQVLDDLLMSGVDPRRILRLQCDQLPVLEGLSEPILRIADWYEHSILGRGLNVSWAAQGDHLLARSWRARAQSASGARPGLRVFCRARGLSFAPSAQHHRME
jgi:hypothetical protein